MAENTLGLFFEISADPSKAVQALSNFRSASAAELGALNSHFTAMQEGAERARSSLEGSFGNMTRSVEGFGDSTLRTFGLIAAGILRNMELEKLEVSHKSSSEASKLFVSKQAIKELAAVKAVEAFAKGLEALGEFNFWSAAQYFASSALYGGLAAIQVAALFSSTGGGRPRGAGGSFGGGEAGGGGASVIPRGSAAIPAGEQQPVKIEVFVKTKDTDYMIEQINARVLNNDAVLHASTAKNLIRRS